LKKKPSKQSVRPDGRRKVMPVLPPPRLGGVGTTSLGMGGFEELDSYNEGMLWRGLNAVK